jgi:hypothetical protein
MPSAALAEGDRADGRVGAGYAQAHSGDPPRGLIGAVGGAQEQGDRDHVRLLARHAESAGQRLVPQMVEHDEDEPRVGEEELLGAA